MQARTKKIFFCFGMFYLLEKIRVNFLAGSIRIHIEKSVIKLLHNVFLVMTIDKNSSSRIH